MLLNLFIGIIITGNLLLMARHFRGVKRTLCLLGASCLSFLLTISCIASDQSSSKQFDIISEGNPIGPLMEVREISGQVKFITPLGEFDLSKQKSGLNVPLGTQLYLVDFLGHKKVCFINSYTTQICL